MKEQAQAGVRIRPGRLDDNRACAAVLTEAVNDLGRRQGSIEPGAELVLEDQWPKWRPFMDHIARTSAEFWVAEGEDDELIGYARSVDRDGAFELTEFFVRPGTQSTGLGTRLLERAFPAGRGQLRIIIATTDIRALSRYLRADVLPRFPVLSFSGPARDVPLVDGLAVESLDLERDMA